MNLPTKEEYVEMFKAMGSKVTKEEWNKSLFKCPRCNGGVKRDYSITFMTDPPKYRYYCKECGYTEII